MLAYGYTDLYGIPLGESNPERHEYVIIKKNDSIIERVSVARIRELAKDETGAYLLRIHDKQLFHWPLTTSH